MNNDELAPVRELTVASPSSPRRSMPPPPRRQSVEPDSQTHISPNPISPPRKTGSIPPVPGAHMSTSPTRQSSVSHPTRPAPPVLSMNDELDEEILDEEEGGTYDSIFHCKRKLRNVLLRSD